MLMKIAQFERLFREAASLDVDKDDLKRLSDFLRDKMHDLLLAGQRAARHNGRDVIQPPDLPVTNGLQQSMHAFRQLDVALDLEPVLAAMAGAPIDVATSEEVERLLPDLTGALVVAYAKAIRIIDPKVRNPGSQHHEAARAVFDLLL